MHADRWEARGKQDDLTETERIEGRSCGTARRSKQTTRIRVHPRNPRRKHAPFPALRHANHPRRLGIAELSDRNRRRQSGGGRRIPGRARRRRACRADHRFPCGSAVCRGGGREPGPRPRDRRSGGDRGGRAVEAGRGGRLDLGESASPRRRSPDRGRGAGRRSDRRFGRLRRGHVRPRNSPPANPDHSAGPGR